jgi:hypothetical protein
MSTAGPTVDAVLAAIRSRRFVFATERELQDGIESVLREQGLAFGREAIISPRDRADFLVEPGICIEVKVDSTLSEVTRQLHRYAQIKDVAALVVVTSLHRHRALPSVLSGKPVHVVIVGGLI